jgi:HlyD family secretion protein
MSASAAPVSLPALAPLPVPGDVVVGGGAGDPGRDSFAGLLPRVEAASAADTAHASRRRLVATAVAIAAVGVGTAAYYLTRGPALPQVTTVAVSSGSIVKTVATTGTVQPVTSVSVGSQVSGTVSWLGADFNSIVQKGQVIARLDPSLFDAQVVQARSGVAKANADLERARVILADAQMKLRRAETLAERQLISRSDLDAASMDVSSAAASLKGVAAQVVQAQASLNGAQVSLDHTVITAPIAGTVVQRSVDVGQTVAASMSSPTIFVIAADLTKMQVNAGLDESDVGQVKPGQPVTFTVDAYPDTLFTGAVLQVRLQATIVSNVTTYPTIIDVPNPDAKLRPGMTATVKVIVANRSGVLRVPNTALRIRPTAETLAAFGQAASVGAARAKRSNTEGQVWTFASGVLSPVPVRVGITDGTFTELLEPGPAIGARVVTAIAAAPTSTTPKAAATGNPLTGARQGNPAR